MIDRQKLQREACKTLLRPMVRWSPLRDPKPGYTIILGTPADLHELLEVNLRFIAATEQTHLDRVLVIFDRPASSIPAGFEQQVRERVPGLPVEFLYHPPATNWLLRRIKQSKFFAATNWVTGLAHCRTRYAILHDFDLYPTDARYFEAFAERMAERGLRFGGLEHTRFDTLTEEDGLFGTWALGIDAEWLRRTHRPIDCYHRIRRVNGRRADLDPFSSLQYDTPQREPVGTPRREDCVHVSNLVSTYLRWTQNRPVNPGWRLHFLCYLRSITRGEAYLDPVSERMERAAGPNLVIDGRETPFANVHATCANVLDECVQRMERFLFERIRPSVQRYVNAFRGFLDEQGDAGHTG